VNYRHAYHAGNFADCMKHALLLLLLRAMARKDKPFLVLDTHAGVGRYDLSAGPAAKTGEWRNGIGKLLPGRPPALADYLGIVDHLGLYPGSPAIAAALLRADDRLVCCELHPEDAAALKVSLAKRKNAAVHERDGYAALNAFLPPPERRALVLIDPPYEQPDELLRAAAALALAYGKFKSGVLALWYPIKHRSPVREFFETIRQSKLRDVVAAELWLAPPVDPARLNGSGLLVVNPPFGFEAAAMLVLAALRDMLGGPDAGFGVERLVDE
jgi:23S rRNA (adenine2030-N6)-methyltransferase